MLIRHEKRSDIEKIHEVNVAAFETDSEARLVKALRDSDVPYISLVAEVSGELVGHILFTPVALVGEETELTLMGLGPMAVSPAHQNKGIGTELVRAGLERCAELGFDAVVVLGHPAYYPRFGFVPSVEYGIRSEYDVPDDVFMVLELTKGSLKDKSGKDKSGKDRSGTIKYNPAFDSV